MAITRTIKQLPKIIEAPVDDFGLYSKAEDAALKLVQSSAQDVHRGADLRAYLRGREVTEREIKELKLDKLLSRRRVTKAELLEAIRRNKVKFSEENITTLRPFRFDTRRLSLEEAYGPTYIEEMIEDYIYEPDRLFLTDDMDEELQALVRGEIEFNDLGISAQDEFRERVGKELTEAYEAEPVIEHKLLIDGNETDYNLLESDGMFFPRGDALPFLTTAWRDFTTDNRGQSVIVTDEERAREFLQLQAQIQGELGGEDDLYESLTSPDGSNYRVLQFKLEGDEVFEGGHFDRKNPVFHARLTDRVDPETGNNILYVEELQNDMSNIARSKDPRTGQRIGFQDPEKILQYEDDIIDGLADSMNLIEDYDNDIQSLNISATDLDKPLDEANLYGLNYLSRALKDYKREDYRGAAVKLGSALANFDDYLVRQVDQMRYDARFDQFNDEQIDALYKENFRRRGYADSQIMQEGDPVKKRQVAKDLFDALAAQGKIREQTLPPAGPFMKAARENLREELNRAGIEDFPVEDLDTFESGMESSRDAALALGDEKEKVPSMQFVTNPVSWTRLAVKRLIKKADEEGYDGVAFSPGAIHTTRYPDELAENLPKFYDEFLPLQIRKVTGKEPKRSLLVESEQDGQEYLAPLILLSERTPSGETIAERATKGMTTYAAPLAAAGLAGLAAPEMAEASDVPINEGIGKLPRSASEERGLLEEVSDFVRYGPEVGLDAVNAMLLRPIAGSLAGRGAFRLGMTPDDIREAQRRAESFVDYEASPETEAYGQRLLGGIGELLQSETAQKAAPYVTPALKALEEASEELTSGIIGLNERLYGTDDDERTDAFLEVIRPGIEATQPL